MKLILKTIIVLAIILASPVNAECNYPAKVQIPNGTINTTEEFTAGYKSVKAWIEKMDGYLDCIDKETTASITLLKINKEHTKEVEQRIIELQDKKFNAAVEDQQRIAQQLNEQVRAYKAAQANK
ncbi:MAG: DNA-binding transcriptional MerR regulator [Woeseiaceae bacterium]|jgi:DNA-binding transcriptional MerR regulator|tara:strand:- start:23319 stop:23693 length:375 start_codon:yes stop_codon:yes gene_type:complete